MTVIPDAMHEKDPERVGAIKKVKTRFRGSLAQSKTAKPRKTLPNRTAMLVAAPGTKVAAAAPVEPPPEAEVSAAPPKPVTGTLLLAAAPDPVAEAE